MLAFMACFAAFVQGFTLVTSWVPHSHLYFIKTFGGITCRFVESCYANAVVRLLPKFSFFTVFSYNYVN